MNTTESRGCRCIVAGDCWFATGGGPQVLPIDVSQDSVCDKLSIHAWLLDFSLLNSHLPKYLCLRVPAAIAIEPHSAIWF